jgi:hypothetical protein
MTYPFTHAIVTCSGTKLASEEIFTLDLKSNADERDAASILVRGGGDLARYNMGSSMEVKNPRDQLLFQGRIVGVEPRFVGRESAELMVRALASCATSATQSIGAVRPISTNIIKSGSVRVSPVPGMPSERYETAEILLQDAQSESAAPYAVWQRANVPRLSPTRIWVIQGVHRYYTYSGILNLELRLLSQGKEPPGPWGTPSYAR